MNIKQIRFLIISFMFSLGGSDPANLNNIASTISGDRMDSNRTTSAQSSSSKFDTSSSHYSQSMVDNIENTTEAGTDSASLPYNDLVSSSKPHQNVSFVSEHYCQNIQSPAGVFYFQSQQNFKSSINDESPYVQTESSLVKNQLPYVVQSMHSEGSKEGLGDDDGVKEDSVVRVDEALASRINEDARPENESTLDLSNTTQRFEQEEIPSFRVWAQKAMEEEDKKREALEKRKAQQPIVTSDSGTAGFSGQLSSDSAVSSSKSIGVTRTLVKNFASIDCGAKIVDYSPGSQGASYIISPALDEYMLNKCADKVWFVIELCESIKIMKVEIASFELYSSGPQLFRVSVATSYPSRFTLFGEFEAVDERIVQSFSSSVDAYGRFVRFELLSHYGKEYYCPISIFRVYGVSEIDLMNSSDDDDDGEQNDVEEEVVESTSTIASSGKSGNLVSFIKDKMGAIVGIFRPQHNTGRHRIDAINDTETRFYVCFKYQPVCPNCDPEQFEDVVLHLTTNFFQLSRLLSSNTSYFYNLISSSFVCNIGLSSSEITFKGLNMLEYIKAILGLSQFYALCNLIAADKKILLESLPFESSLDGDGNSTTASHSSFETTCANEHRGETPLFMPSKEQRNDVTHCDEKTSSTKLSKLSISPTPVTNDDETNVDITKILGDPKIDKGTLIDASKTEYISEETPFSTFVSSVSISEESSVDVIYSTKSSINGNNPSIDAADVAASVLNNNAINGNKIEAAQRESVWQKLTSRIKSLERNVTLSGGYLEELSIMYKKQIEDLQASVRHTESEVKILRAELALNKNQTRDLIQIVSNLTTKVDDINAWALGAHSKIIVVEIFIGVVLILSCFYCLSKPPRFVSPQSLSSSSALKLNSRSTALNTNADGTHNVKCLKREYRAHRTVDDFDRVTMSSLKRISPFKATRQRKRHGKRSSLGVNRLNKISSCPNIIENKQVEEIVSLDAPLTAARSYSNGHFVRHENSNTYHNGHDLIDDNSYIARPEGLVDNRIRISGIKTGNKFGVLNSSFHDGDRDDVRLHSHKRSNGF